MDQYQFPIVWQGHSVQETQRVLSEGMTQLSKYIQQEITFDIGSKKAPPGTLRLDPGIVIAIVSSSAVLTTSILSCISQVMSARIGKEQTIMEVSLEDGISVKIPLTATKQDIENLIGAAKSLSTIKKVSLLSLKDE